MLKLTNNYYIKGDSKNYELVRRSMQTKDKDGNDIEPKEKYTLIGHYGSLTAALKKMIDIYTKKLVTSDKIYALEVVLKAYAKLEKDLCFPFKEYQETILKKAKDK